MRQLPDTGDVRPEDRERERIVGRLRAAYSGDMLGTETFELRVADAVVGELRLRGPVDQPLRTEHSRDDQAAWVRKYGGNL